MCAIIKFAFPEQVSEDRRYYSNECIYIKSEKLDKAENEIYMTFLMQGSSHCLFLNAGVLEIVLDDERTFYGEFIMSSNNWNETHTMLVRILDQYNFMEGV